MEEKKKRSVDLNRSAIDQSISLYNRWHPDIPSVISVGRDDVFRIECFDWTGGHIGNNDSTDDVKNVDLTRIPYLSEPIEIEGIHTVDALDVSPLSSLMWEFTRIFDQNNGEGFVNNIYPEARKAIWNFSRIYATSRHIKNEATTILANLSVEKGAYLSRLKCEDNKNEGAKTISPHEHGENTDIKHISRDSHVYLPVYVNRAKLSLGNIHFLQGDEEIAFCGAI